MSAIDVFWDACEGPIRFGVNDCCMVTADVVLAAGGPDLMDGYRGRYTTARGFVRVFRRAGHVTLLDASLAMLRDKGRPVEGKPGNYDVAMVPYLDGPEFFTSPGFHHDGYWFVRSPRGSILFEASAFPEPLQAYRVI